MSRKTPIYQITTLPGQRPGILSKLLRDPADLLNLPEPEITVITVCLNSGKFIEDTIRSVANQSFRNFEHVVVDGGSKDNTLEILKKYPHIRYISEPDKGYPDGFWKGLRMSRGKYIIQCTASDVLATTEWLADCMEVFRKNPDVSLVWGLNQWMTEEGEIKEVGFPQFHYVMAPQKEKLFTHWLINNLGIPEMNLCASRLAMLKCYPSLEDYQFNTLDWADFTYNFHRQGFLAYFLPVIASFSRVHKGQMSETLIKSGWAKAAHKNDIYKWKAFRRLLMQGREKITFVDRSHNKLKIGFSRVGFVKDFLAYKLSKEFLLRQIKRGKKIPAKLMALIK